MTSPSPASIKLTPAERPANAGRDGTIPCRISRAICGMPLDCACRWTSTSSTFGNVRAVGEDVKDETEADRRQLIWIAHQK